MAQREEKFNIEAKLEIRVYDKDGKLIYDSGSDTEESSRTQ